MSEHQLDVCPKCGGPADNGFDRCLPPNAYFCSKCTTALHPERHDEEGKP